MFLNPAHYRARNRNPCDACRRRRAGCYPSTPGQCLNCTLRNKTCTFESVPKRKSTNSNKSIRKPGCLQVETTDARQNPDVPSLSDISPGSNQFSLESESSTRRALYIADSGDHDPYILQFINHSQHQTKSAYVFQRVTSPKHAATFFSLCPPSYLDSRPGEFVVDQIEKLLHPETDSLITLYFETLHRVCPVMDKSRFLETRKTKNLTASLLASLLIAVFPLKYEQRSDEYFCIRDFNCRAIALETGAPSLQTIQAIILYLQRQYVVVRESNQPGNWALCASLVAASQELGLHKEPSKWTIPVWERRLRRRLWWATYVQDKWLSFGLGRPSHINDKHSSVTFLCAEDFAEDKASVSDLSDPRYSHAISLYVALVQLTLVLSEFLQILPCKNVRTVSETFFAKLDELRKFTDDLIGHNCPIAASWILAHATLDLSISRSLLHSGELHLTYPNAALRAESTVNSLLALLSTLSQSQKEGTWWSISRVNLSIVGSVILTFYLASRALRQSPAEFVWKKAVSVYKACIDNLARENHVAKLAQKRFNTLIAAIDGPAETPAILAHNDSNVEYLDSDLLLRLLSPDSLQLL